MQSCLHGWADCETVLGNPCTKTKRYLLRNPVNIQGVAVSVQNFCSSSAHGVSGVRAPICAPTSNALALLVPLKAQPHA